MTTLQTASANADLAASLASAVDAVVSWVRLQQLELFRGFVDAIGIAAFTADAAALAGLVASGLLYGVFHAVGPGPGKAALAAYLLSHPASIRRAAILGLAAALAQGLASALLVLGGVAAPSLNPGLVSAVSWADTASALALAAVGLGLAWLAAVRLHRVLTRAEPAPRPLNRAWLALAIGLRPDVVGVMVLYSTLHLGAAWVGGVAIAAMAAGTGIAIAMLCTVLATARGSVALILGLGGRWSRIGGAGVGILGGVAVAVVGAVMLGLIANPIL